MLPNVTMWATNTAANSRASASSTRDLVRDSGGGVKCVSLRQLVSRGAARDRAFQISAYETTAPPMMAATTGAWPIPFLVSSANQRLAANSHNSDAQYAAKTR
ncbi:hypothetical protein D3C87_827170 [compost metagenome]